MKKGRSRIVGAAVATGAIFAATTILGSPPAFAVVGWTNTKCQPLQQDPGSAIICISQDAGDFQSLRGQLMAGSDSIYNDGFFQYPVPATPIHYCGWATTAANTTSTCYFEAPYSGRNVELVDNYYVGQTEYQDATKPITS